MKWIQTYSGQIINLDHMAVIEKSNDRVDPAVVTYSGSAMFVIAEKQDGEGDLDEVMKRISLFIEGKQTGYNKAFYSFSEADKAREDVRTKFPKGQGTGGGRLSDVNLPRMSIRFVSSDADTPYHIYADDELVEKVAELESDAE